MHGTQRKTKEGRRGKDADVGAAKTNKPVKKAYKLRYLCGRPRAADGGAGGFWPKGGGPGQPARV